MAATNFGDLKTPAGLGKLNTYLADKSYITGWTVLSDDSTHFTQVGGAPDAAKYPNVARWYRHIASFDAAERSGAPGAGAAPAAAAKKAEDDFDLFGDDNEEDAAALKAKAIEEAEKRAKKKAESGKSSIIFDVKPWDDTIDMAEIERRVRAIQIDGLVWGAGRLEDVVKGIKKLSILCVVEDAKVSVDWLEEAMKGENAEVDNGLQDFVQSVDISAFNKI